MNLPKDKQILQCIQSASKKLYKIINNKKFKEDRVVRLNDALTLFKKYKEQRSIFNLPMDVITRDGITILFLDRFIIRRLKYGEISEKEFSSLSSEIKNLLNIRKVEPMRRTPFGMVKHKGTILGGALHIHITRIDL